MSKPHTSPSPAPCHLLHLLLLLLLPFLHLTISWRQCVNLCKK